jgi:F1F0 ATPase subunit 2
VIDVAATGGALAAGVATGIAGFALGLLHFGGLRWTVARIARTRSPLGLLVASSVIRLALLIGALWLASGGHAGRIAFGLLGALLARAWMLREAVPGRIAGDQSP